MKSNNEMGNPLTNQDFRTHLVMFDKPKCVLVNDTVEDVFGMVIATTCKHTDSENSGIKTYRIPLTGELLEPGFPFNQDVDVEMRMMPDNKKLTATIFKDLIFNVNIYGYIMNFLTSLTKHQVVPDIHTDTVTVKVQAENKGAYLSSDWFRLYANKAGEKNYTPNNALIVFRIMQYLKKPFVFETEHKPGHPFYKREKQAVDDLNHFTNVFLTSGYYTNDYMEGEIVDVCYDGTYLYAPKKTRCRVKMSLDRFLKKYPKSHLIRYDEDVFNE